MLSPSGLDPPTLLFALFSHQGGHGCAFLSLQWTMYPRSQISSTWFMQSYHRLGMNMPLGDLGRASKADSLLS